MKEHHVTNDPYMPLSKWQDLIDQLIADHGPQVILTGDIFNYSHIRLIVKTPEPPKGEPDGEFINWESFLPNEVPTPADQRLVCFDARDRYCPTIQQIIRARDEGAFPIRYWLESRS